MPLKRRSFLGIASLLITSPVSVFASEGKPSKRILVYGDSNSFGWAWSPEKDIYRLPIDQTWPRVMAQKLGSGYEVEVNALGGRTIKRDQKDGNGTGKSLSGKSFNGMTSLPAVLSENLPLDLVIVMLGTNDANSRHKNNAKAIANDLEEMTRLIQAGEWQSNTQFKTPKVLIIVPPLQPDETAYGDAFNGAEKITKELPLLLKEKCRLLGAEYLNSQDFVKGIPGQIDRAHLSSEQHKLLGEAASEKVKEIFAH